MGSLLLRRVVILGMVLILSLTTVLGVRMTPPVQAVSATQVYVNDSAIRTIQDHIRSGDQPWQSANERLVRDANRALNAGPYRVTANGGPNGGHDYLTEAPYCGWKRVDGKNPDCRDGQINPEANRQDYSAAIAVGRDVRTLGLAYALTRDEQYARRVTHLIRVWALDADTRMTPRFTNGQSNIELAITMPGLFYGADLIRSSDAWTSSDQQALERWSRDFLASGRRWTGHNNFEVWRLVFLASGGAAINDRDTMRYAFDRYKHILPDHIGDDGQMVKELGRTKSLMYSLYALNAFTQVAEIAHQNGTNLYDYQRNGRSLKLALDYHVPYVLDPSRWQRQQIAPIEEKDIAHYEVAYAYFRDSDYQRVITEWGRPLYEQRTMGPVTLTHAVGSDSPAPAPPTDPTPTPIPDPDPTPPPDATLYLVHNANESHNVQFRDCPTLDHATCWYRIAAGQWLRWQQVQLTPGDRLMFHIAHWDAAERPTFAVEIAGQVVDTVTATTLDAFDWYTVELPDGIAGTLPVTLRVQSGHSADIHMLQVLPAQRAHPEVTIHDLVGITDGATVSGDVHVEADITGRPEYVLFTINGPQAARHVEHVAPYVLFGDHNRWDTTAYPDGEYTITVMAPRGSHTATRTERVTVSNTSRSAQPQTITLDAAAPDAQQGARYRDCSGDEAGRCLGWIAPGEWVEWQDIAFAGGTYQMDLRAAPWKADSNATFAVLVDGQEVTRMTADAPVGRFSLHQGHGTLAAGSHTVRLRVVSGHSIDIRFLRFVQGNQ